MSRTKYVAKAAATLAELESELSNQQRPARIAHLMQEASEQFTEHHNALVGETEVHDWFASIAKKTAGLFAGK